MTYIARETLIACVINTLFTLGFFFAVFSGEATVSPALGSQFSLDYLPQAFFVGLFSALPITLITQKRLRDGLQLDVDASRVPLPQNALLRIVCLAVASLIIFGGLAILLSAALLPGATSFTLALIVKVVFALVITITIAPLAIRALAPSPLPAT